MSFFKKHCPYCLEPLSIPEVKTTFLCPNCNKRINGNPFIALIVSGVISGFIEIPFNAALNQILLNNMLLQLLHIMGTLAIFMIVYFLVLSLEETEK